MFPNGVREVIAKHLVEVYSNVFEFAPGFKTTLMDVFGGPYSEGVELGIYSRIAVLLEKNGLLVIDNLEMVVEDTKPAAATANNDNEDYVEPTTLGDTPSATSESKFIAMLSTKQLDPVDIQFLAGELETITLEVLMRRMRKCRAGARLQRIVADMPDDCRISSELKARIEEVVVVLKRSYNSVVRSMKKIKKKQVKGGQRL